MRFVIAFVATASVACDPPPCEQAVHEHIGELPSRLSQTHPERGERYQPRFELWSDGAAKQRWVFVPDGEAIDRSAPDAWTFPVGTTFWKEFARDGRRIETRVVTKTGAGGRDWNAVSYVWRSDQSDADAMAAGDAALGVPAAKECWACHGNRTSFVLGYSRVQLEASSQSNEIALQAQGYLHANCSHCHNRDALGAAQPPRCLWPDNDVKLELGTVPPPAQRKKILQLMSHRSNEPVSFDQMPPLGTRQVDEVGLASVRQWFDSIR